jgi:hypothetical protein
MLRTIPLICAERHCGRVLIAGDCRTRRAPKHSANFWYQTDGSRLQRDTDIVVANGAAIDGHLRAAVGFDAGPDVSEDG